MEKNGEEILEKDIKEFLKEKEKIRTIIGKIGGKVTFVNRVANLFWIILVTSIFATSIFVKDRLRLTMIDIGILLVSFKIMFYFHRLAKVSHFQFWILSSIEWRINEITKKINELSGKIKS